MEIEHVRLMYGRFTRTDAVRCGVRMWLNHHNPARDLDNTIVATASDIIGLPALEGAPQ